MSSSHRRTRDSSTGNGNGSDNDRDGHDAQDDSQSNLSSSSPRADEVQREQDHHLARSLGGIARTRTADPAALSTPQRGGSGAAAAEGRSERLELYGAGGDAVGSPTHADVLSGLGRTGSSIGGVGAASGRRASGSTLGGIDNLEDQLEQQQQAHQDSLFFDDRPKATPEMTSSSRRRTLNHLSSSSAATHAQSPSVHASSAAATRFYRQHRNLSDASVDSQGGAAYIDHRRPAAAALHSSARGQAARNVDAYSSGRAAGSGSSGLQRGTMPLDGNRRSMDNGNDGEDEDRDPVLSASPRSFEATSPSGFSGRTARQQQQHHRHLTAADLDENAVEDEDDDQHHQARREQLERHLARTDSYRSQRRHSSVRNDLDSHHQQPSPHAHYLQEISRPGSAHGIPEEDVCFPVHGGEPDLLDLGMGSMGGGGTQHSNVHHGEDEEIHRHNGGGVAGVTSNFPFPFDFDALEEFADREKEGMPLSGSGKRAKFVASKVPSSPPTYAAAGVRGRGMGMRGAGTATNDTGGSKTMRQRKLSESVAPARFQRKLALFEGSAGLDPSSPANPRSILDAKSPLLAAGAAGDGRNGDDYGTNDVDGEYLSANNKKNSNSSNSNNQPPAGAARPYRFSFYSNALPSTIHARSLAEIPAEGQTFEELFVGRRMPPVDDLQDDDSYAEEIRAAFSPPPPSSLSQPGTGAHTPTGQPSSRDSLHGAARATAAAQASSGANPSSKNQPGRMRTEIDAETNTWWLDVLCPTDQEMKILSKVFGIHPLTTEDIQMEETREKIELFRNYYFVCFRSFEQDPYSPTYLEPLNMYIIVFREGTLSFHFRGTPHPQNVRRRIKQLKDYITVTSDWISYALIDGIVDAFGPLVQNIEYEVDSIDELVLILKEAEQSDMLRRIGTCRKKVMGLLRLMGNKADVVKGLYKRCNENWSVAPKSDIGLYLSDIQDHITTSTQNLTHYEKILSRSHSNYLAQISIEMTDANNEINNVLSKLTALGTILIPMNLVTGLWGMNVHVPGQDVSEGYTWFLGIIGFLAGIALFGAYASYTLFARK